MITNDPGLARRAEAAGVERLLVDLEQIGKRERQGHLDTLISCHSIDDIAPIKAELERAELIVRLNPLHPGTAAEIEAAIDSDADTLMLPMFHGVAEVAQFCQLVEARARTMPLVETRAALEALEDIAALPGVDEIYLGLNDLHLDLGLAFMFQPLAEGLVESAARITARAGLPFGFGGVARVGEGTVPGELILAEHARLGSTSVILSRTFTRDLDTSAGDLLAVEVEKLRASYAGLLARSARQIEVDRRRLVSAVEAVVRSKSNEAPV